MPQDPRASLLDPDWDRTYGGLERALAELVDFEHDCECATCHRLAHLRAWNVATLWLAFDHDARREWENAYFTDPRGAALRDALSDVHDERLKDMAKFFDARRKR